MARPTLALVLGGAACVWDDIAAALDLAEPDYVFACNDIGTRWPHRLDGWVTLHPEKMVGWRKERKANGFTSALVHVGNEIAPGVDRVVDYRFPSMGSSGSSGLYAAKVAMELADRIVLCGVPMQAREAHFFDAAQWAEFGSFTQGWQDAMPYIKDRVRSMSGWTKELLGAPSPQWLAG
jgi:hypothetical protein